MLTELDQRILKSGEKMRVCLLTPPADELMERLKELFAPYDNQPRRDIYQRFRGDYADKCEDFYFLGMIGEQIAGVVWYGYAKKSYGIANFGNVYTAPTHRKKNVTNILMEYFAKHFKASKAKAAFCTCSNPWIVSIYTKHGFRPVLPGTEVGFLMLANQGITADFTEFTYNYYAATPKTELSIVTGDIGQRHPIDTVLHFYKRLRPEMFKPRIAVSSTVRNYQHALHFAENGKGKLFAVVTDDGRVMGWAFCVNPLSDLEQRIGIIDYEIHPAYIDFVPTLIKKIVLTVKESFDVIYAQIPSFDPDKTKAFVTSGFKQVSTFAKYGQFENSYFNLDFFSIETLKIESENSFT